MCMYVYINIYVYMCVCVLVHACVKNFCHHLYNYCVCTHMTVVDVCV